MRSLPSGSASVRRHSAAVRPVLRGCGGEEPARSTAPPTLRKREGPRRSAGLGRRARQTCASPGTIRLPTDGVENAGGPGAALRHSAIRTLDAGAAVPAFPPLEVMARRAVRLGAGRAMPRTPFGRSDLLRIVAVRAADDLDTVSVGPGQGSAAAVIPAAALGTGGCRGHAHAFRCRAIREHTGRPTPEADEPATASRQWAVAGRAAGDRPWVTALAALWVPVSRQAMRHHVIACFLGITALHRIRSRLAEDLPPMLAGCVPATGLRRFWTRAGLYDLCGSGLLL